MTNVPASSLLAEPGVRFGLANALIVVALFTAAMVRLDFTGTEALVTFVAGVAGAGLPIAVTASLGFITWAMVTGFAENHFGVLTFAGADVGRLFVFVLATVALSTLTRHLVAPQAHPRPPVQSRTYSPGKAQAQTRGRS